jgi:hypothetical protein
MIKKVRAQEVLTAGLLEKGMMSRANRALSLGKDGRSVLSAEKVENVEQEAAVRNGTIPGMALKKHRPCVPEKMPR